MRKEYDLAHPDGPDLLTRIGIRGHGHWWHSETSGDTANDLELLSIGTPRNTRERAEVSALQMKQQIRDAGVMGPVVAGEEFDRLDADYKRLMSVMGADDVGFDSEGKFVVMDASGDPATLGRFDKEGNFLPQDGFTSEDLAIAMTVGKISAENYRAATDRVADAIATALVVTAAIVTTALTGGAAASIWIPVLVTMAAGVAAMGVKYAIKGGRYGTEEMAFDLATTMIQAATAGVGAAAGAALRGGGKAVGALARNIRLSEQMLATAATGGTATARQALPALTLGQEMFVGALSQGLAGGASAAINPASYHSDHYASDILNGIIRGSMSGAIGAGVTRGVVGGVTKLARGIGAVSGAREALARGATLADAQRFAAARSRLYSTSALTEVGGRALGSATSSAVSRAIEHGYNHALLGQKMTATAFWDDVGMAFAQGLIQGAGEGMADRAMRGLSRTRLREHAFTTRDDIHDYRQRAADAVLREGRRLGRIPPASEAVTPGAHPPTVGEPAATPGHDGRTAGPTIGVDESGAAVPARLAAPETETPASSAHPSTETEPTAAPARHVTEAEREPVPILRTDDPEGGTDKKALTPANDNPGGAKHQRVALSETDMLSMPKAMEGSVFVHPDSKDLMAANDNFGRLINADPTREAAIHFNPVTGEYVVIQGGAKAVAIIRPGGELSGPGAGGRLVTMEGVPQSGGYWIVHSHFHPNRPGQPGTAFIRRLPSGFGGGDFGVLHFESTGLALGRRSSRIYYSDDGKVAYTDFGIEPGHPKGTYWIDYPDPVTGNRVRQHFETPEKYGQFLKGVRDNPELAAAGGTPGLRTADTDAPTVAPPRALAPGSEERALTPADRTSVRALADEIENLVDHRRILGVLAERGASENLMKTAKEWVGQIEASSRSMVHALGLVGEADSMARLHLIMNDHDLSVPLRQAIADSVLEATRAHMVATGQLDPGEPLMLLFHGAPDKRTSSIKRDGIDMGRIGGGSEDDFGRGFYLTSHVEAALTYRSKLGAPPGEIFPFVLRARDVGTTVDVSPGGAHRAAWEAFVMTRLTEFGNVRPLRPIDFQTLLEGRLPFGTVDAFGNRGRVFEAFLVELARTTGRPELATPDFVNGELGGPMTSGVGTGDQQAARTTRVADVLNDQMGFRRSTPVESNEGPILRMADEPEGPQSPKADEKAEIKLLPKAQSDEKSATAKSADDTETAVVPEPEKASKSPAPKPAIDPAHEDQALARMRTRGGGPIVDSIAALAKLDRPAAMAVLHAETDAEAKAALANFRDQLIAKGMNPAQADARARRLDLARATLGGRFRTEVEFFAGKGAVSTKDLSPKLAAWVTQSAVLQYVHAQNPTLFHELHTRFVAAKAGKGGKNRAPNFERFVIKALARVDPVLFARAGIRSRDEAVIRMVEGGHHIAPDVDEIVTAGKARPPSQSGAEIDDPATVKVGMRVDHEEHGRGTVQQVSKGGVARIHFDPPSGAKVRVPVEDGELKVALEPDPRFDKIPPVIRSKAEMDAQFKAIETHRTDMDLPVYAHGNGESGTVARLELAGEAFHGTNSGLDPANFALPLGARRELFERLAKSFGLKVENLGQAKFLSHAEAEALIRAYTRFGALPEVVELFVDRPTCPSCNQDLIKLAKLLGVKELKNLLSRPEQSAADPEVMRP